MKIREKNARLKDLIAKMEETGRQENKPFWRALAKKLNRPRRKAYEVNLFSLERYAGKETVIVPGYVLGTGDITKPVNVAALKFSAKAEEKIKKAGGKVMDVFDFVESRPNLKTVKIMG
ncbi:MAG: 50S ribosomal protein L18e [Candidatus Aenigmatarchaeota archaeon]|nr:MAG: 50S ribosomal protein L18e [Candidatus Aenigmarchaeota archaeon]